MGEQVFSGYPLFFTVLLLHALHNIDFFVLKEKHMETGNPHLLLLSETTNIDLKDKSVKSGHKGSKPSSCPVIDFLATVDASARLYDPDLICDELAPTSDLVCRMHFRQIGLDHLAKSSCKLSGPAGKVPRLVYFVIFGTYIFKFWHYVAIMAAQRNISPTAVYVIGDQHPLGRWWQRVLRDIQGVR